MSTRSTFHLSESRLIELTEGAGPDPHLATCARCRARLAGLQEFAAETAVVAEAEFTGAFPEHRIDAARLRVLAALDAQRPAQVVPFPGVERVPPAPARRRRPRWMAAAAAGLILGLLLGRWTHWGAPVQTRAALELPPPATVETAYATQNDDEFLRALEALHSGPVAVVRALHELTPTADAPESAW